MQTDILLLLTLTTVAFSGVFYGDWEYFLDDHDNFENEQLQTVSWETFRWIWNDAFIQVFFLLCFVLTSF